jgi:hypothetical protein
LKEGACYNPAILQSYNPCFTLFAPLLFGKSTAEAQRAQIEIHSGTAVILLPSLIFA